MRLVNLSFKTKTITFLYFALVAVSIIGVHALVFWTTSEDMERLYAEARLDQVSEYYFRQDMEGLSTGHTVIDLQTQGKAEFDPMMKVVMNKHALKALIPLDTDIHSGVATEVEDPKTGKTYFVLKKENGAFAESVYFLLDNSFYELIEERLPTSQTKWLFVSLAILALSLIVVLKISSLLSRSIENLAADLKRRHPDDQHPLVESGALVSKEVEQLVTSINEFQNRITYLIDRERAFNRYASHELRTPLMVIKGAVSLLKESKEEAFVDKQIKRLDKAATEMQEFIQTLLNLSKAQKLTELSVVNINKVQLAMMLESYRYLQAERVSLRYEVKASLNIKMHLPAFNILLGNLVKNALANTKTGEVCVRIDAKSLNVIDSGCGIDRSSDSAQGYGLGLLLVKDICHQYGCEFSIQPNETKGSTATIKFI